MIDVDDTLLAAGIAIGIDAHRVIRRALLVAKLTTNASLAIGAASGGDERHLLLRALAVATVAAVELVLLLLVR